MIDNGCKKGKINYDRKGAMDAAVRLSQRTGTKIYHYHCKACDAWHISRLSGRKDDGRERKKRERYLGPKQDRQDDDES